MKKISQILLKFLLIACMCMFTLATPLTTVSAASGDTVILYTANLRGDISILPQIAQLKAQYESDGSEVILVDAGNYFQGTIYSTYTNETSDPKVYQSIITLMDDMGYDIVGIGSHEFDFGTGVTGVDQHGVLSKDGSFSKFLAEASFIAISANIIKDADAATISDYQPNTVYTTAGGLKIGFFGLSDPNMVNQVVEANLIGLTFSDPMTTAEAQKNTISADVKVCLSNAGNIPSDAADAVIDVGSGAGLKVGQVVINSAGQIVSSDTISLSGIGNEATVKAAIDSYKAKVDAEYPSNLVAKSNVTLNGSNAAVRSGETNLGDFWADALLWFAKEGGIANYYSEDDITAGNTGISVDADHVVAVWNGGNLRDYVNTGDVTMKDLQRVLPYPNSVAVVYLTGNQLLELLESATQALPWSSATNAANAAFLQAAGLKYTVAAYKAYDKGDVYGTSGNWFKANSLNRVTITEVNGKPFNIDAVYAVVTSNAIYNGMDSNYICAEKDADRSTITSAVVRDVVWMYLSQKLNGVIGTQYSQAQGRITILLSAPANDNVTNTDDGIDDDIKTGTVNGYLVDESGIPIAGAKLVLHPDSITTTTDSKGYFEFKDVPVGNYKLYYVKDDGTQLDSGLTISVTNSSTVSVSATLSGNNFTAILAENTNPKTIDNTNIYLYLTLLSLSVFSLVITLKKKARL